jgi:LPS-assembly protein
VTGKLDIDIVSDQDYLVEWERGETGWQWTNDYFTETFGRGLDDFNDYVRKNQLNLRKGWSRWDLNMTALWYDDVILRRQSDVNPTLQQLPTIEFQGSRQPLFKTPLYFRWNSQYVNFFRENGPKSQRLDLYPRLYYPLRVKNYFTFEPSVGIRETLYFGDEDAAANGDRFNKLEIFDVTADLFTEVFNVFHTGFGKIDRIKHSIRPQFVYNYTPDIDQTDLPLFDGRDRIGKQNILTYSLTNSLIARSGRKSTKDADADEGSSVQQYDYREFFRFKLDQSYDFNRLIDDEPRPFSNLNWRVDLVPFQYLKVETNGQWDPYETEFVQHNMSVSLSDIRGDRFFIERRFTQDSSDSIYLDGAIKLTDKISAYGFFEQNILDDIRIQSGIGVRYVAQCWSFDITYVDDGTDRRYEFAISLHGLGQIRRSFQGRVVENPFTTAN